MMYLNNLGEFSTLADVWKAYPYGGKEGDYVTINGEKIGWNKYSNRWGGETNTSLPSSTHEVYGDLEVKGNLRVMGHISSERIEVHTQGGGIQLTPDVYHVFAEVSSLEVWLAEGNEFFLQFTSGATPPVVGIHAPLKWEEGTQLKDRIYPEIKANRVYQIHIFNGLAKIIEYS